MRCHICDRLLSEPVYNRDHEEWDPCRECLEVIQDTLSAFRDRPSIDEDESGFSQVNLFTQAEASYGLNSPDINDL